MRKIFILTAAGFAFAALLPMTASYAASVTSDTSSAAQDIFGRRGADDPKGHIRGEGVGHPVKSQDGSFTVARRGRGADDPKGHIRGEGVGHPVKSATPEVSVI